MGDILHESRTVLMDGAMGMELLRAGAAAGECFELWNVTHPKQVRAIHRAYVEAGAEVLLTNTFQANPVSLARHGLLDRGEEIGRTAVELTRTAGARWVLGDIGPMAEVAGGVGFPRKEAVTLVAKWLKGVDGILLETCSDRSAFDAAPWIRQEFDLPVWLSMTYRTDAEKGIRTWDRQTPEEVANNAVRVGVAALGVNCGLEQDIARMAEVVQRYRAVCELPLFARPNAGTPRKEGTEWIYPHDRAKMASEAMRLVEAGARFVGGCCGTTPEHIRDIGEVIRRGQQ